MTSRGRSITGKHSFRIVLLATGNRWVRIRVPGGVNCALHKDTLVGWIIGHMGV